MTQKTFSTPVAWCLPRRSASASGVSGLLHRVKATLARQLDELAARRHRSALRADGVPLEVALTLAKDFRPRHLPMTESLGQKGHRDWTQLRARTRWLDEADQEKLDLVLASLVRTTRAKGVEFEIQDVSNILLSKSKLSSFASMHAFEHRQPNNEYRQGSRADLERCLAHDQVRCLKGTLCVGDSFTSFGWDERLLLNNQGGSHHFSAARRIARELDVKVPLQLDHEHHVLDADAVHFVEQTVSLVVIPYPDLWDELKYALRREQVPVIPGCIRAPVCYGDDAMVLPLSIRSDRAASAAAYLRSCGFIDLVDHLIEDLGVQQMRQKRLN